mmetsp:Transcript_1698/g.3743  ORF Transcript_1698/g.3743 Transcript_1698/m.3743 type:complete len:81 (-) Transcript_1698:36-278(-)
MALDVMGLSHAPYGRSSTAAAEAAEAAEAEEDIVASAGGFDGGDARARPTVRPTKPLVWEVSREDDRSASCRSIPDPKER